MICIHRILVKYWTAQQLALLNFSSVHTELILDQLIPHVHVLNQGLVCVQYLLRYLFKLLLIMVSRTLFQVKSVMKNTELVTSLDLSTIAHTRQAWEISHPDWKKNLPTPTLLIKITSKYCIYSHWNQCLPCRNSKQNRTVLWKIR